MALNPAIEKLAEVSDLSYLKRFTEGALSNVAANLCYAPSKAIIRSILITEYAGAGTTVYLEIRNTATGTLRRFVPLTTIAANDALEVTFDRGFVLNANDYIYGVAGAATRLNVHINYTSENDLVAV